MVDRQIGRCSGSECIVENKMVGRQMGRMVEHLGQLQLVVAVEHTKIHNLEDKLEHIEHWNCRMIGRMVDRQQHR